MDDIEFRNKKRIANLVSDPYFATIIQNLRTEMAVEILSAETAEARDKLYYTAKALEELEGRLNIIVNEVKQTEKNNAT